MELLSAFVLVKSLAFTSNGSLLVMLSELILFELFLWIKTLQFWWRINKLKTNKIKNLKSPGGHVKLKRDNFLINDPISWADKWLVVVWVKNNLF